MAIATNATNEHVLQSKLWSICLSTKHPRCHPLTTKPDDLPSHFHIVGFKCVSVSSLLTSCAQVNEPRTHRILENLDVGAINPKESL